MKSFLVYCFYFHSTGFPIPVSVQSPTPAHQLVIDVKDIQLNVESLAGVGVQDTGKSNLGVFNCIGYHN